MHGMRKILILRHKTEANLLYSCAVQLRCYHLTQVLSWNDLIDTFHDDKLTYM